MLKTVIRFLKATGAFLKALVRAREDVVAYSANGHGTLRNWPRCPEEEIAVGASAHGKIARPRLALYCYEGPHEGELSTITGAREFLGSEVGNSIVLTPGNGSAANAGSFLVSVGENVSLSAQSSERGSHFRLNGTDAEECTLFDYDEVELLGNKFLVLDMDLRGVAT